MGERAWDGAEAIGVASGPAAGARGSPTAALPAALQGALADLMRQVRQMVADEVRAQVGLRPVAERKADKGGRREGSATGTRRSGAGQLAPRAPTDLAQPILDAAEAAWLLRYPTLKAFYQAVHRYGIPHSRRGQRVMLFRRLDLEKFLASRSRFR